MTSQADSSLVLSREMHAGGILHSSEIELRCVTIKKNEQCKVTSLKNGVVLKSKAVSNTTADKILSKFVQDVSVLQAKTQAATKNTPGLARNKSYEQKLLWSFSYKEKLQKGEADFLGSRRSAMAVMAAEAKLKALL